MKIGKMFRFALFALASLPKTVYFNLKTLPLKQALKLPILVGYKTKIVHAHPHVIQFAPECKVRTFLVRIGFGGSESVPAKTRGLVNIAGGKLTFGGQACFAEGATLDVSGNMTIGKNFSTNKNAFISCSKEITIGERVMLGWDVEIFDASGHTVYQNGEPKISQKPIVIGNHVWLASHAQLLKGAQVGDDSVVAWRTLVTKAFPESGLLIAGNPAQVKQTGINWGEYIM